MMFNDRPHAISHSAFIFDSSPQRPAALILYNSQCDRHRFVLLHVNLEPNFMRENVYNFHSVS